MPSAGTIATDLHGHTRYSDGRATPEDYVRVRAALGLEVIAVSDHDTFAAVPAAAAAATQAGVTLLPAMEVTSFIHFGTAQAEQIHVLAYFPPGVLASGALGRSQLGERAVRVTRRWRRFVLDWLASLPMEERYYLDPDGLASLDGTEFPALQRFLDHIMACSPRSYQPFVRHHVAYWEADAELFGWQPEEAIEAIRADGGVDVVAHPVRVRDKARMQRVLDHASGLEVYTSRHKASIAAEFRALAEARGKLWTASSDDHQHSAYVAPPAGTPRHTIERLLG
ncbi:MAG: PHP domain-containing protein [Deltaproteobacteria bacterium]|nr:PHP domain-containing protein [Deltaproteobacteria bacterium]